MTHKKEKKINNLFKRSFTMTEANLKIKKKLSQMAQSPGGRDSSLKSGTGTGKTSRRRNFRLAVSKTMDLSKLTTPDSDDRKLTVNISGEHTLGWIKRN